MRIAIIPVDDADELDKNFLESVRFKYGKVYVWPRISCGDVAAVENYCKRAFPLVWEVSHAKELAELMWMLRDEAPDGIITLCNGTSDERELAGEFGICACPSTLVR